MNMQFILEILQNPDKYSKEQRKIATIKAIEYLDNVHKSESTTYKLKEN